MLDNLDKRTKQLIIKELMAVQREMRKWDSENIFEATSQFIYNRIENIKGGE